MTTPEQQETERRHVLAMIERLPLEIVGEPVFGDRPDARLVLPDGRRIGLEHTEAMDKSVARGRGVPDRIRDGLREALVAADVRAFVSVTLPEGASTTITSRAALAAEIAAVVAVAKEALTKPGIRSGEGWRFYEFLKEDILMPDGTVAWHNPRRDEDGLYDLDGLGVTAFTSVKVLPCDEPNAGCNGTASWSSHAYLIQEAIDAKAGNIDEYRKSGEDEQWLLVVGSSGGIGTALTIDDAEGEFVSPFDQTIFLELYQGKAVHLRTRPP